MKKISHLLVILLFTLITVRSSSQTSGSYSIKSTYATVEDCNYVTGGIFIIWWDKTYDYSRQAKELLATLEDVRTDCLTTWHMSDPPNPLAGFYYNVYIHNPKKDLFPDDWAMGQGTDDNKFPYLTIPVAYAKTGSAGAQHEGFHIFQYKANSPGFRYTGDSQWFIEATANWYAASKHPGDKEQYITASAVTSNPQVTMWYSFENREPGEKENWQRGCHQYGMNIFLNYLTDVRKVPRVMMAGSFYDKIAIMPQEYLYNQLGGEKFAGLYADFAAHNVSGYPGFPAGTEERAARELKQFGDSLDIHPIVKEFDNCGTNGQWIRPGRDFVTRGWGYNVYKIKNASGGSYTFELKGDDKGSEGAAAAFCGRIVVRTGASAKPYSMKMDSSTSGKKKIRVKATDAEVYLVVAATPRHFTGNQTFSYEVKIDRH